MGQTKLAHCFVCNKIIYRKPGELRKNKHNFCSQEHYLQWTGEARLKSWTTIICRHCNKTKRVYKRFPYRTFCSKKCAFEYKKSKHRKAFIDRFGYWCLIKKGKNGKRQNIRVHTLIAEKILGRKLDRNEIIHHINMKTTDNRHKNLLICDNGYHRGLHSKMAKKYAEKCSG